MAFEGTPGSGYKLPLIAKSKNESTTLDESRWADVPTIIEEWQNPDDELLFGFGAVGVATPCARNTEINRNDRLPEPDVIKTKGCAISSPIDLLRMPTMKVTKFILLFVAPWRVGTNL